MIYKRLFNLLPRYSTDVIKSKRCGTALPAATTNRKENFLLSRGGCKSFLEDVRGRYLLADKNTANLYFPSSLYSAQATGVGTIQLEEKLRVSVCLR